MSNNSKKVAEKAVTGDKAIAGAVSKECTQPEKTVVYIGPDLKNIVSGNTIFKDGIPEGIKKMAGKIPVTMKLFVPLEDLPGAVKSIAQGGAYRQLYNSAVKETAKINKGENAYE